VELGCIAALRQDLPHQAAPSGCGVFGKFRKAQAKTPSESGAIPPEAVVHMMVLMIALKIGNIGNIVHGQRLNWQQRGNKSATCCRISAKAFFICYPEIP
jgi:hypothetical protein